MRISSGLAKNKTLEAPRVPGIRLTQEIVREAVFSIIGDAIQNTVCLDLYAGSGSIGIEALSRGAKWCDFVDTNYESTRAIQKNLVKCGFELMAKVYTEDAVKYVGNSERKFDFVFMDPYYTQLTYKHIIKRLPEVLKPQGMVVFLHGKDLIASDFVKDSRLKVTDERKYGATVASFLVVDNTNLKP